MSIHYQDYRWDEILDSIHNGVVMIDNQGHIVLCNPTGCALIGVPKEHLIGRHINDIVEDSQLFQVMQDGTARPNQQQRLNGRIVVASSSPIHQDSKIVGAVSVFQDITELKSLVSQLDMKDKEINQFNEVFELVYDGIVLIDEQARVTMITQAYCDFLGVDREQSIGKPVTEVIENTRMHLILKSGEAEIGHVMRVKDRDIIVMRLPIKKNGKIVGAIGKVMFNDIHELKTLAKRLNIMESKLDYYKNELKRVQGSKYSFDQIIGEEVKMKEAKELALKVADSRSTVLIRGESGTGKELFAHAIHGASQRSEGPFIRLNCAAIPADLIEAEIFGYEEGAFTGAKKGGKPGKIELAQGGTLFLDEIGDMPMTLQVKLLRTLQEREMERVGGVTIKQVDIRIIAATHRSLEDMIKRGEFREDLYYRLNVFHINIPPLRDRGKDILTTAHFILAKLNEELGRNVEGFHPDVENFLMHYAWPGNVREMQNVIERSIHLADHGEICMEHLPPFLTDRLETELVSAPSLLEKEIEKTEMRVIKQVLKESGGNRNKAAKILGIHRASLYRKLEKYNLV